MDYRIRDSYENDAHLLAPNLREADLEELDAVSHHTPLEVLHTGWRLGAPCRTFLSEDNKVVGMFGVIPIPYTKDGIVWCLSSPELFKMKMYFMRNCRREIKEMCEGYEKVSNSVYEKNVTHVCWIKAMGFDMKDTPYPFGRYKKPFYYFEKVTK